MQCVPYDCDDDEKGHMNYGRQNPQPGVRKW